MSTHSYELEAAQQAQPEADPRLPSSQEEPDDDLMYDVVGAAVRGFYTPYHPNED
ncbi:hypothetical protein [Spirosoma sp.]|uniref:hypothetical protein n=1 Tax=Spirosoma sp. TaxID=1899569 RepID=UPI00262277AB|nr:hypothetical protein [Spirosoma sp.]MCX6216530.1 hypothetical protein [Spirosoma sp.]